MVVRALFYAFVALVCRCSPTLSHEWGRRQGCDTTKDQSKHNLLPELSRAVGSESLETVNVKQLTSIGYPILFPKNQKGFSVPPPSSPTRDNFDASYAALKLRGRVKHSFTLPPHLQPLLHSPNLPQMRLPNKLRLRAHILDPVAIPMVAGASNQVLRMQIRGLAEGEVVGVVAEV